MKAMILEKVVDIESEEEPLKMVEMEIGEPGKDEVLIKVSTCGVCHTEIDEIEGRAKPSFFPIILGHQVVGRVVKVGSSASRLKEGDVVGVAWVYSSCGQCEFCRTGRENLCSEFKATGKDAHGGYAEFMVAKEKFTYRIPEIYSPEEAAPLLCAGAIGYRSLRLTGIEDGMLLGLTGFGASGHLVLKMVRKKFPRTRVFVFARSEEERRFALQLGAVWAGDIVENSPELLDAIIDTTPVWKPVVESLKNLKPGGRLVINAIRKEEVDKEYLLKLDYPRDLWMEKEMKSVANVARADVEEFLELAASIPIKPEVQIYLLEEANRALRDLKKGSVRGAKVLSI